MRFRRKRRTDEQPGGEDAFLDIVANLVGILVILVMVIGVRAQDAWVESAKSPDAETTAEVPAKAAASQELLGKHARAAAQHHSLDQNVREVNGKFEELGVLVDIRQRERHQLQVLLNAARQELDGRREELDETAQRQVAMSAEIRELEASVGKIKDQRRSLETDVDQPIELEHLPTPLARTVFGSEEHFQLKGGRLSYVPLNELTELLRSHAPTQLHRLSQVAEFSETLGPIQGFNLTYTMHRQTVETESRVGPVARQVAELKQFVLTPLGDVTGEPVAEAVQPDSQFYQLVETFRPGATVVTVWTYPDSYREFRQLKSWLFDRGFASAARPLPDGQPISGSPRGSRSAAQ